jgi:hypothetical protein
MANVDVRYVVGQSVRFLDVAPMILSLRLHPDDFEYAHGWLHHIPSRHRFLFDRLGRVAIDAVCGCGAMSIRPDQTAELFATFMTWHQYYWRPFETNREFASHFEQNNFIRFLRDIRMALRRLLCREPPIALPKEALSPVSAIPAE